MTDTRKISEASIEKAVCQYAISKKALQYKFVSTSRRSVPDRMFVAQGGRVGFIEFKRPGGKVTKMQEREMAKLTEQGCPCVVIDSVEAGKKWIDLFIAGLV